MNNLTSSSPNNASKNTFNLCGYFLIAMPSVEASFFNTTVTYICDHNEAGALGVIINKTTELTLNNVFSQLGLPSTAPSGTKTVLCGGPVEPEKGLVIHTEKGQWHSTQHASGNTYITVSKDIIEAMANGNGPSDAQLVLGYAGWSAGQLEEEIEHNHWLTLPADDTILFTEPAEKRWDAIAKLMGIDLNLISSHSGRA